MCVFFLFVFFFHCDVDIWFHTQTRNVRATSIWKRILIQHPTHFCDFPLELSQILTYFNVHIDDYAWNFWFFVFAFTLFVAVNTVCLLRIFDYYLLIALCLVRGTNVTADLDIFDILTIGQLERGYSAICSKLIKTLTREAQLSVYSLFHWQNIYLMSIFLLLL